MNIRKILVGLIATALCGQAVADLAIVKAGATSQQIPVRSLVQSTGAPDTALAYNTSGLSCNYVRPGSASTSITLATQTATGAYSSGGFVHLANGWNRLDIPDAALATGVPYVLVTCTATGDTFVDGRIELSPAVDVESWNAVATGTTNPLPNAVAGASGGLLISGSNAGTTTLGALTITGATTHTGNVSMAAGLNITQSSSNTAALIVTGNGTGNGATITSGNGATGTGLAVVSAATNGSAATFAGVGTGNGVTATGGATGNGFSGVGGATSGAGIRAAGTAGNSPAMTLVGQGSAAGLLATGGATGHGISAVGGATSGDGLRAAAATSGKGINAIGVGTTQAGILATGGATTSAGISAVGGATSGDGISAVATTSGVGITATGVGTTKAGIAATGGSTTSAGISATGGGTGAGLLATSGSGATGNGIQATAASTNGSGFAATGIGTGNGATYTGGATGNGLSLVGGATSGNALKTAYTSPIGPSPGTGIVESGILQSATGTTAVLRSATSFPDDTLVGATLVITGGTGVGQSRAITAWVNSSDTATVATWTTTPDSTSTYEVWGTAAGASGSGATAAEVWSYGTRLLTAGTNIALAKGTGLTGLNDIAATDIVSSGAINTSGGAVTTVTNLTNAPTAGDFTSTMKTSIGTAVAASAVASVTGNVGGTVNGLTSTAQGNVRTSVGLATANLDTQLAAVQSDTDNIQTRIPAALVGGKMDSDVEAINNSAGAADNLSTTFTNPVFIP